MVSDEYIRMSREAKELQDIWEPKEGDLVFNWKLQEFMKTKNREEYVKPIILDFESLSCVPNPVEFWLPRQEDLQEIILKNNKFHAEAPSYYKHTRLLDTFFMWWSKPVLIEEAEGINILWLKLLMELLYNKRWDGNGWVKQ